MGLFGRTKINKIATLKIEQMLRSKEQKAIFEKALNLYQKGNYPQAYDLFQSIANDDIEIDYYLAMCALKDKTKKTNPVTILNTLRSCAENEYTPAFVEVAAMYEDGRGLYNDKEKAIYWYKKGAKSQCDKSQFILGCKYINGKDVKQNFEKGLSLLQKSAEQNNINALYLLGHYHDTGQLVEQNDQKAAEFYQKAADLGDTESQARYGYMLEHGRGVEKELSKAVSYYEKAAAKQHKNALYRLGIMYKEGIHVSKDIKKAADCFLQAADQHHAGAMIETAKMYTDGTFGEPDALKAINLYLDTLAVNPRDDQRKIVYVELIEIYLSFKLKKFNIYKAKHYLKLRPDLPEDKVKKFKQFISKCEKESMSIYQEAQEFECNGNLEKTIENYTIAGYGGISDGYVHAGKLFEDNPDCNYPAALQRYKAAEEDNNPWAYECIGHLYEQGLGVEKNINEAMKYYQLACDHGRTEPLEKLVRFYTSQHDHKRAFACRIQLANAGNDMIHAKASYEVAHEYAQNNDAANSKTYYLRAIELGYARAIAEKADEYITSYEQKKAILQKVSASDKNACYKLYQIMKKHPEDQKHADSVLKAAADLGHAEACYELAVQCWNAQHYEQAIDYFEKSSNAKSCWKLSKIYREGLHIEKDRDQANTWIYHLLKCTDKTKDETILALEDFITDQKKAPENWSKIGHILESALKALVSFGIFDERYLDQVLLYSTESAIENAEWYNFKMADAGIAQAEYRYGLACYENTYTSEKNHNLAYAYLRRAANQGHLDAMFSLAEVIFNGRKEIDYDEARAKYQQSIEDMGKRVYNNTAKEALYRYQNPENIEKDIDDIVLENKLFGTQETLKYDLNQLVRKAEKNYFDAIEYDKEFYQQKQEDYKSAYYKFAAAYNDRFDHAEGMYWLNKAAESNHVTSMMALGLIDIDSDDFKKRHKAKQWLKKAADTGDEEAIQLYQEYSEK